MIMPLLSLPRELLEQILLLLDLPSILSCRVINREFNIIIQSSTLLQYHQACAAACVIDNPHCDLSYAERLDALKRRESAWACLKPVFMKTVKVNHVASTIYDLTAGTYLLGDSNFRDLHYCRLPSSPDDDPKWVKIPGHGPEEKWSGFIVDMGMALHEHDLIVNVISSEVGVQTDTSRHRLDMVLLQFSTGQYHPLAQHPRIHVQRSPSMRPAIALEIVGDNLALVVSSRHGAFPDRLFIFDWKTGAKKLQHEASENAYSSLAFVSTEILLVPNLFLSQFEVWRIPLSPPSTHPASNHSPSHLPVPPDTANFNPPHEILSLHIPSVSQGYFLLTLSCRGEPNPFISDIPHAPRRPFHPSPEDSIIIANLRLASFRGLEGAAFTLVMHRRALLDTITRCMDRSPLFSQVRFSRADIFLDTNSGKCTAYSGMSQLSHQSTSSLPFLTFSQHPVYAIPWKDWGPSISRWFEADETQTRWITTSAGQRCAFLDPPDTQGKTLITLAEFNPVNLKRHRRKSYLEFSGGDKLGHGGVFWGGVDMGLKGSIYMAPGEYEFDGLLMDEERLLGLKINEAGRVESFTVLHFG